MRMYLIERAEKHEITEEFQERLAKAKSRSKTALKVADRKREATAQWVRRIRVQVAVIPLETARRNAIASYNEHQSWRDDWWGRNADENSDPAFLERITVNYLRHEQTSYDNLWGKLVGRVGRQEAHELLRERILDEIANKYPDLAVECGRQKSSERR